MELALDLKNGNAQTDLFCPLLCMLAVNIGKCVPIRTKNQRLVGQTTSCLTTQTKLSIDIFDVQNNTFYLHPSIIIMETTREDALRI